MELRINSNAQIALFVIKGKIGWDNSRILDTQIHKMVEKGCSHIVFNGKIFKSFEEFSESVLKTKGLVLNLGSSQVSVINTEEHRFDAGASKAA